MTPRPFRQTLTIRNAHDIVACVPYILGFHPEHSVVLLSLDPHAHAPSARLDLPKAVNDVESVVKALIRPVRRYGVDQVAVVIYGDDTPVADECGWAMYAALVDEGVDVLEVIRVHAGRLHVVTPGGAGPAGGVECDLTAHHFMLEAMVAGKHVHTSREDVRDSVAAGPDCLDEALLSVSGVPAAEPDVSLEGVLLECAAESRFLTDAELLRVVHQMRSVELVGDWGWLDRSKAVLVTPVLREAMRRLPDAAVGEFGAAVALSAWVTGDGALAWCVIDRCRDAGASTPMLELVADLLEEAVSPNEWDALWSDPPWRPAA